MAVHNLDLATLKRDGLPPAEAMKQFEAWLKAVVPAGALPVFVGFNAAFDWMFVADYFDRFLGRNPFGHTALDLKSYYMGLTGGAWSDTTKRALSERYPDHPHLTHNALQDAIDQAALFRRMRAERLRPPTNFRRGRACRAPPRLAILIPAAPARSRGRSLPPDRVGAKHAHDTHGAHSDFRHASPVRRSRDTQAKGPSRGVYGDPRSVTPAPICHQRPSPQT